MSEFFENCIIAISCFLIGKHWAFFKPKILEGWAKFQAWRNAR